MNLLRSPHHAGFFCFFEILPVHWRIVPVGKSPQGTDFPQHFLAARRENYQIHQNIHEY
jgi:hypothetical protein